MQNAPMEQMAMSMGGGMEMVSMEMEVTRPVLTVEEQIAQAEGNIEFLEDIKDSLDEDDWEGMIESIEESIEELEENL